MPPVQENYRVAVATAFSDSVSWAVQIMSPSGRHGGASVGFKT